MTIGVERYRNGFRMIDKESGSRISTGATLDAALAELIELGREAIRDYRAAEADSDLTQESIREFMESIS